MTREEKKRTKHKRRDERRGGKIGQGEGEVIKVGVHGGSAATGRGEEAQLKG